MSLTLELPEALQRKAEAIAAARGESVETLAAALLAEVLASLSPPEAYVPYEERQAFGTARMREICAARGLDWDQLGEEAREQLLDQLLHEDEA